MPPDACSYQRQDVRTRRIFCRHQLLAFIWLSCSAFTWPGRVPHLGYSAAHGTVSERVEALRLLEEYPSQASTDACLARLEDSASEVRAQAARCVSALADDRAISNLLDLASAKDPQERAAALEALGRFSPARALSTVEQALADAQPSVRLAAAHALTGYVRAGSIEPSKLAAVLRSDDTEMRLAGVALLEALPNAATRVGPLTEAARDKAAEVRAAALRALGHTKIASVFPTLQSGLSDADETARLSATAALGDINLPGAVSALRTLIPTGARSARPPLAAPTRADNPRATYANAPDVRAARTVLAALGRTDDPSALTALAPALTQSELANGAVSAIITRARRLRDAETLRLSAQALHNAIEATRKASEPKQAADSGAGTARADRSSPTTTKARADSAPNAASARTNEDQRQVIDALARGVAELARYCDVQAAQASLTQAREAGLGDGAALAKLRLAQPTAAAADGERADQLVRSLDDKDARVRERASLALARSADDTALSALAERLERKAPHAELTLQACAGAMLRASDSIPSALRERLLQQFQAYLTQPDETLATNALYALRASRDPRAARWIAALLRGSSAPLRAAAVQALGDFDQTEARRLLRDMLRGDNIQSASNAAIALAEIGSDRDVEALLRAAERGSWPLPPSAAYAAARITQRGATRKHSLERLLCRFTQLRDTYVLANSVAALAALGAEACNEQVDPRALLHPALPSALRVAAATWLHNTRPHTPEETVEHSAALAHCAADHDAAVAAACTPHEHPTGTPGQTLLRLSHVDGQTTLPNRVVALRLPDATVFIGQTDAAGQLLLPRAESGSLQLEDPADEGTITLPPP